MTYYKFRFKDSNNRETSELYGRLADSIHSDFHEVVCFLPIIRWRPFTGYCYAYNIVGGYRCF